MKLKVTSRGFKAVDAKLARLARGGPAIARAAVRASLGVLAAAARAAAPGLVKEEVGFYIRGNGASSSGRAGLMQYPRRGDGPKGPHGVYLDQGTKYIQARHFIGQALTAAIPAARQAAKNAGYRTAQRIARTKGGG